MTDPTDAVVRLVACGERPVDTVIPTLRDAYVDVATTAEGQLLVGPASDGVECVAVATAGVQRRWMPFEHWRAVTVEELVAVLPDGVDILLNPFGAALTRPSREGDSKALPCT